MPRRRSLTSDAIARAALAVLDRDGIGGLSMRAVATQAGVGTMSLYRYVENRTELESLVVEMVLGEVDPVPPAGGSWQDRIAVLFARVRVAVGDHPAVVPLLLSHRHSSARLRQLGDAMLGELTHAGLTGRHRVIAFRALLSYVIGALQTEHLGPLSGQGTAALAALDRAEYPYLAETAAEARTVGPEEEFPRGLRMVLRGLAEPDP
ncbi:MAG: TetR/AcrR family transcriptional regulator [Mycobacteriales bacterium]